MYKILVLKNRIDVDITDDCQKAVAYFAKHNINVSFDFKDIDEPVSCHFYTVANDGGRYYGIDDYVKDSCDKYVEKGKYHTVIFAWNTKDVPAPTDGALTSWGNWSPLTWAKADTEFIQLITNDTNDKIDWIYLSIIHEIMHTLCFRFNRRGLRVIDEMDMTIMPNGERIPYYKNPLPDEPDGNFAQTFENMKPYLNKVYDFYFIDQEKPPFKTLSIGMYGASQLQRDLKTLGYFTYPFITGYFGIVTQRAVKAFQKANGITQTGNYGPITDKALQEALKKNSKSKLDLWALAIQKFEGYAVGSRSYRNNNPGNIKYVGQSTATGQDDKGFCIFPTYEIGFEALKSLLKNACLGKSKYYNSDGTLYDFFNVYAPSSDNNSPKIYTEYVAKYMGVDPSVIIKTLII